MTRIEKMRLQAALQALRNGKRFSAPVIRCLFQRCCAYSLAAMQTRARMPSPPQLTQNEEDTKRHLKFMSH
eukprot:COSAG04_NODE_3651_length_2638_cov_1.992911_2_plen_71_part_00